MGNLQGKKLGIICGGGPAPGMNSVISSVTLAALKQGCESVTGFHEGFKHLSEGKCDCEEMNEEVANRIFRTGGVYLKTARTNPSKSERMLNHIVDVLKSKGITHLVTIGGEDTGLSSMKVAEHAAREGYVLKSVHVPKTIDNDLPLPEGIPTFGYETARHLAAEQVKALAEDAKSTNRWYVVICMGRKAGFLTLGTGVSSAATITLIPEEFNMKCTEKLIVDTIVGAIFKQMSRGIKDGIALIAEGFLELKNFFAGIDDVPKDDHGHPLLSEINFSGHLKNKIQERLAELGFDKLRLISKDIGYELRCTNPTCFDLEYTRQLGWAAVDFLANDGTQAMITLQNNRIVPMLFGNMFDAESDKVKVRTVNTESVAFKIAKDYMIRLEEEDLKDHEKLEVIAEAAKMTPEKFKEEFGHVIRK